MATDTREKLGQHMAAGETGELLIDVRNLQMYFPVTAGFIFQKKIADNKAIDGVTFNIKRGETMGLVGESGCGKSTTGRCILQLYRPTGGQIMFGGRDLVTLKGNELRLFRRKMQMIFQDPYASLNPRMSVRDIIGEPLVIHNLAKGKDRQERVSELMKIVGLNPYYASRFPHEFSGGQRQRIGIARALAVEPALVVCDEPVSALDVSIQAQVVNLLKDLQARLGLSYLFIAHDLAVVKHMADRVAVMYLGQIVEIAPKDVLFSEPRHPYTRTLMAAIPRPDPHRHGARQLPGGDVPSPMNPPSGCRFHTRCPFVVDRCREETPLLRNWSDGHLAACHRAEELPAAGEVIEPGHVAPMAAKRLALYAERRAKASAAPAG